MNLKRAIDDGDVVLLPNPLRKWSVHPTRVIVITGVRRGQGSARETLRRENPERGSRPGFLSFRPY